jgi:dienelactone hydrolase
MKKTRLRAGVLLALLLWGTAGCTAELAGSSPTTEDPETEVRRTWEAAEVLLDLGGERLLAGRMSEGWLREALSGIPAGKKFPTVIYLHGCSGMGPADFDYMTPLARAGYAVIAPRSFARRDRPETCDPRRFAAVPGAPHRRVRGMRQEEILYASRRARELPWVERENFFLMGHSQGGSAAAAYAGEEFRARVISGSTCNLGVNAPAPVALLAIYSENDPWLRGGLFPRGCEERARGRRTPLEFHLFPGRAHSLAGHPRARELILAFLKRHTLSSAAGGRAR